MQGSPLVKPCLWHIFLLHIPFAHFYWGYDGLRKRLSILFLHHGLHTRAIHLFSRRVVLLVFVEDNRIVYGF